MFGTLVSLTFRFMAHRVEMVHSPWPDIVATEFMSLTANVWSRLENRTVFMVFDSAVRKV